MGGIIGGAIYNGELDLLLYVLILLSATVLMYLLNYLSTKFMTIRRIVMVSAIPIIIDGKLQINTINNNENVFDLVDFFSKLRSRGIFSLQEIDFAQIETDGSLTVIKKGEGHINRLLVKNGEIVSDQLAAINQDEHWLKQILNHHHLDIKDVFLVEMYNKNHLHIIKDAGDVINHQLS